MKADHHAVNYVELSETGQRKKVAEPTSLGNPKGSFLRGKFSPKFGAYNSPDLRAGSIKFTETMATRQMNIPAKFREASSNG